jgi:hypothetical protein
MIGLHSTGSVKRHHRALRCRIGCRVHSQSSCSARACPLRLASAVNSGVYCQPLEGSLSSMPLHRAPQPLECWHCRQRRTEPRPSPGEHRHTRSGAGILSKST